MKKFNMIRFLLLLGVISVSGLNFTLDAGQSVQRTLNSSSPICGNNVNDVLFINSQDDLELLRHCETFNSSLFLTGGYDINTLEPLSNTERILGYLVIIDSHILYDLYGLHNLEEIRGSNLYIDSFGISIRHNLNESGYGLCYADRINWDSVTETNKWIEYNDGSCPVCHEECDGCWSKGPRLCQLCRNYKSGVTCVIQCPRGTIVNGSVCLEKLPNKAQLYGEAVNQSTIRLLWEEPEESNGVVMGYEIFHGNTQLFYDQFILNSNRTVLSNNLLVSGLETYSLNNFTIRVFNTIGYSNISDILSIRSGVGIPPKPVAPNASLVGKNILVKLESVSDIAGPIIIYKLVTYYNDVSRIEYEGEYITNITIVDITSNVNYSFVLEVFTNDVFSSVSDRSNLVILEENNNNNNTNNNHTNNNHTNNINNKSTNKDDNIWTIVMFVSISVVIVIVIVMVIVMVKVYLIYCYPKCKHNTTDINVTENGYTNRSFNNPVYTGETDLEIVYDDSTITIINSGGNVDNVCNDNDESDYIELLPNSNNKLRRDIPSLHPKNMLQ